MTQKTKGSSKIEDTDHRSNVRLSFALLTVLVTVAIDNRVTAEIISDTSTVIDIA